MALNREKCEFFLNRAPLPLILPLRVSNDNINPLGANKYNFCKYFYSNFAFSLILGENNVFWINSVRKLAKKWPCDRKLSKIFQKWTDFNLTPPPFSSIMGLKGTFRLKLCLSSEVLKKKREDFKHIYALFWVNRPVLSTFYVFKVWINDNSLTIFCLRHLFLCFFFSLPFLCYYDFDVV